MKILLPLKLEIQSRPKPPEISTIIIRSEKINARKQQGGVPTRDHHRRTVGMTNAARMRQSLSIRDRSIHSIQFPAAGASLLLLSCGSCHDRRGVQSDTEKWNPTLTVLRVWKHRNVGNRKSGEGEKDVDGLFSHRPPQTVISIRFHLHIHPSMESSVSTVY